MSVVRRIGVSLYLALGVVLITASGADAQAPIRSKLKKVLVLDKSQGGANGHFESRRDFNAALASLAAEKGFMVTTIRQNDPASAIAAEFSAAGLAKYQVVVFGYNDGVHAQLNASQKADFEAYVENGGGFIAVHSAQDFIQNWQWLTSHLVECFYGPHGSNQPTAKMAHDAEGMRDGAETRGIFKGLTLPETFLDEFYSFKASPRGRAGVTILLTVDERTYSKPVNAPMGDDHPVVWTNTAGKGRIVNFSLGHSWSTNNVYTAGNGYLTKLLYGNLRYAAGDFVGCMDSGYEEYDPDATRSDSAACRVPVTAALGDDGGTPPRALVSKDAGRRLLRVGVRAGGPHAVRLLDVSGRPVETRKGAGPAEYALEMPARSGLYVVVIEAGGRVTRQRVTVL